MRDLISEIDALLLAREADRERHEKDAWWPSEMFACRRQLWYKIRGEGKTNPIELAGLWKMGMGNELHSFVNDLLHALDLPDLQTEVAFRTEVEGLKFPISGRMDNRFTDVDGAEAAFDLKSTFGQGIRKVRRDREISRHYLGQMMVYLAYGDIDRMYLAFLGRDDSYRACFVLAYDSDGYLTIDNTRTQLHVNHIVEWFRAVEDAKDMPERDYTLAIRDGQPVRLFQRNKVEYKSDWQCSYCAYRDKCWAPELEKFRSGVNLESFT